MRRPGGAVTAALTAAGLGLAVLLAGCGQAPGPGGPSGQVSATAAPGGGTGTPGRTSPVGGSGGGSAASHVVTSSLDVTVTGLPGGRAEHSTLTCGPAGGTYPDPAATCASLERYADPFAPVPHGTMCPAIVTGPARATISGDWNGRAVRLTLTEGGCDLMIWARLSQLLGGRPPA